MSEVHYCSLALYSEHEEADNRLLYKINHSIKVEKYARVIVVTPHADVFVSLKHHFNRWIFSGLNQMEQSIQEWTK